MVQGTPFITGYYTKMKKLREEMNTINITSQCTYVCTCGRITKMHKVEQDNRLIKFQMGLNEMYTMRGHISMMKIFPSMAQAFAILSQLALESTFLSASASPTPVQISRKTTFYTEEVQITPKFQQ